jgi:hypothetical protein
MLLIIIAFLAGLYFALKSGKEGFNVQPSRCPDLLIQKGQRFYLYNSKLAEVPGVNPVVFNNLEDYVEFLEWQRSQGISCPVLYIQQIYDAQGNPVYKARPGVLDLQGGLPPSMASLNTNTTVVTTPPTTNANANALINPALVQNPNSSTFNTLPEYDFLNKQPTLLVDATQNDPPYNINSYPAHDESNYYQGMITPLDKMDISRQSSGVSPDPMDSNWGGADYTQMVVDKGYYKGNEVYLQVA